MKSIIGIVGAPNRTSTEKNIMCVFESYRKAVIECGGIPILILPTQNVDYEDIIPSNMPKLTEKEKLDLKIQIDLCDGIIFPGGTRIYEYAYEILNYIYEKNIPCLGTCLGMQTIACFSNNKDSKNTLELIETNINHKQIESNYVHNITIKKDSKLYKILENEIIKVNSKHRYCVKNINNIDISAISEDGVIEAIEDKSKRFVIGVQWHPEELVNIDENMKKIFKAFIIEAENYRMCRVH